LEEIIVNGYAYPFIEDWILAEAIPNLTFLSMFTYGITSNGDLVQLDDEELIAKAGDFGVGALMVLTAMDEDGKFDNVKAHEMFNDPVKIQRLIDQIEANIKAKGLSGIDFDFEFLLPQDREAYAAFINDTRLRLSQNGYFVLVAAAPKTYAQQPGLLYEAHDYNLFAKAADYVLLMTYEWGYAYGPPMAVAPINMVRKVLDYGVSVIPRGKILMGIPNYGYDWTLPYAPGNPRAENISNVEAVARAQRFGAEIQWDPVAQSPWYTYFDGEGNEHQVWFENEESIRAKLNLVNEYGLGGISYWNLMYPFPGNWRVLNSMFKPVAYSELK
jgi:spore germination protein